jgi:hypothetical protein
MHEIDRSKHRVAYWDSLGRLYYRWKHVHEPNHHRTYMWVRPTIRMHVRVGLS